MRIGNAFWALAAGGLALWAVMETDIAPGLRAKVNEQYREHVGWTAEARRDDPVGFLEHSRDRLKSDATQMEAILSDLSANQERVEAEIDQVRAKRRELQGLLEAGRGLFNETWSHGRWPVGFAGAEYGEEQLRDQLRILFRRDQGLKRQARSLRDSEKKLTELIANLHEKRAEVRDVLSQVETSVVIARAQTVTASVMDTVGTAADVMTEVGGLLKRYGDKGNTVRSAEELIDRARVRHGEEKGDAAFQAFLDG